MSVSYKQRWIWHSSNIQLRLMSCLDLELEARVRARKPYWTTSTWTCMASHSVCTLPRARSKSANPSSYAVMAPSLLSSSLSRARRCFCNSMATADAATASKGGEVLHQSTSGDQCHNRKQAQAIVDTE
jgi:hypothetical protein